MKLKDFTLDDVFTECSKHDYCVGDGKNTMCRFRLHCPFSICNSRWNSEKDRDL